MSQIQENNFELRYLKRENLKQETKMIGNWYRDIIRSYGIDVIYHKLDTSVVENFNGIVDQNLILQRAYGQIHNPDYSCKAEMISYMEVEQDIFQLQKYGLNPNTDVNFYFDITDFATALATKLGQYQEYPIKEMEITCEVPDCTNEVISAINPDTKECVMTSYVSAEVFPYNLGLGYAENYECGMLKGKLSVAIDGYDYGVEQTVVCDPYEHTDFEVSFPSNEYLYKSFVHSIANDDYLQTMIQLTFKVDKVVVGKDDDGHDITKNILHGKIHGGVLFYNMDKIGKFITKIHPEVGDLITIDFPEENKETYEITDCYDKQLTNDGISPLLGTYIWKCKARRYVNSNDNVEMNEADKRAEEKRKFERQVDAEVIKTIARYDDNEDAAYGGYDMVEDYHDQQTVDQHKHTKLEYLPNGTVMDIINFACKSKLTTDGYDLIFVTANGDAYKLTMTEQHLEGFFPGVYFDGGLRFLKASKECLVFTNIEGTTFKLAEDELATQNEMQLCLNSLFDKTVDPDQKSQDGNNFFVFKESKTVIWATEDHLYCKLASNGRLYRLV